MSSRAPLLPETHFHAETPSPPRLEYPSSRLPWMRAEALLKRETMAQESGKKVVAIHRLLPPLVQLTVPFIRNNSTWNSPSNAMAGCSGLSADYYDCLPLTTTDTVSPSFRAR